jgi:hypothetical protein
MYCRVSPVEAKIEAKRDIKNPRKPFVMIFQEKNFEIRSFQMNGKDLIWRSNEREQKSKLYG